MIKYKDLINKGLLPVMVLFMFLFNVVWSTPISILSRAFSINEYHIFTNFFVLLAIGICIIYGLVLYFFKNNKTIHTILVTLVYGGVLASTLYLFVLPYRYGAFEENILMGPKGSLLGFSKWYYLLDLVILTVSATLAYISTKSSIRLLPLILILFYTIENVKTLATLDVSNESSGGINIPFSTNHENLIIYIQDANNSLDLNYAITNAWTNMPNRAYTKDFTFYNNVLSLYGGLTFGSIPSMVGGYDYTVRNQLLYILSNKISHTDDIVQNLKYFKATPPDTYMFYTDIAAEHLDNTLDNKVDLTYTYIATDHITTAQITPNVDDLENSFKMIKSPVLAVSVYPRIPYLLRFLLSKNTGVTWKDKTFFEYRWIRFSEKPFGMLLKKTEKSTLNIIHTFGTHLYYYPLAAEDIPKNYKTNMLTALNHSMTSLDVIIKHLKENNIYDSTKIIITSDHGTETTTMESRLRNGIITTNEYNKFRDTSYIDIANVPLMIKEFNSTNTKMTYDNRALALPDIYGMAVSTFTNIDGIVDYSKQMPPKREFSFLPAGFRFIGYHMDRENSPDWMKSGSLGYHNYLDTVSKMGFPKDHIPYTKATSTLDLKDSSIDTNDLDKIVDVRIIEE